jgi:Sulfotransferase family
VQSSLAKPIFIVGSPRSGTSVLTWCLGQHPNIFPIPESNWMGEFAIDVAKAYQVGAARGGRSVLSAMDIADSAFFATFGQSINDLILARRSSLETKRELDVTFTWKHTAIGPKSRWVDGTPEYSLHICGLLKLFPGALFIHLVRDVDAVVRSLLNFHKVSGVHLVGSEEEAYLYWLHRVKASLKAEEAYGPKVVHRLLYSTLIGNPEAAIHSLLGFVGESYSAACLEPLGERINSSNVPADFECDEPATDRAVVEEARRLSAEIERTAQPQEPSAAAGDELEMVFEQSCVRAITLEQEIARQAQHYTAALANLKQSQLKKIRQLAAMLDQVTTIAASLQSSRFWTFANKAAAIEAKLFRNKEFVPDHRFQKVLTKYSRWRASHPQMVNPDEYGCESRVDPKTSDRQPDTP